MKGKRILSTAMAALTLLTAPAALPQQALLLNPITASAAGKPGSEAEAFAQQPKSTTQIIGTTAVFTAKASANAAKRSQAPRP